MFKPVIIKHYPQLKKKIKFSLKPFSKGLRVARAEPLPVGDILQALLRVNFKNSPVDCF